MIEVPEEVSTRSIVKFLRDHGADLVGVASIDRFPSDKSNRDPRAHFRRAESVVVFARRVAFSAATPYPSVASLQFGDFTLEAQLNELAYESSLWLENGGEMTMPMPCGRDVVSFEILQSPPEPPEIRLRGSFDLRYAAVVAGLGRLGANGLVISERFGSRIRLCAILTTAKLEATPGFVFGDDIPEFCHSCGFRCAKACPADALSSPGHVDHYKCLAIRPDLVSPEQVLNSLATDLRGSPIVLAAKQLSYTTAPPHTCSTCTTQCPMDEGRALVKDPFIRECWNDADFLQASSFPPKMSNG